MDPIDRPKSGRIILSITRGPNMHAISSALCPVSHEHWLMGVGFQVNLPYEEFGLRQICEHWLRVVLLEFKAIDINASSVILGGLWQRGKSAIDSWQLLPRAPIQIPNYSIQGRKGQMEMSYDLYASLFEKQK